jgi:hypothetical protein
MNHFYSVDGTKVRRIFHSRKQSADMGLNVSRVVFIALAVGWGQLCIGGGAALDGGWGSFVSAARRAFQNYAAGGGKLPSVDKKRG